MDEVMDRKGVGRTGDGKGMENEYEKEMGRKDSKWNREELEKK